MNFKTAIQEGLISLEESKSFYDDVSKVLDSINKDLLESDIPAKLVIDDLKIKICNGSKKDSTVLEFHTSKTTLNDYYTQQVYSNIQDVNEYFYNKLKTTSFLKRLLEAV